MTLDDYIADPAARFATVAMTDTNGLLRGQMVSTGSLKGIARNGMGMAPVTLALDPTDVVQVIPGVSDGDSDFHDDPLLLDPATVRRLPWSKPGYDMLVLSNYSGATSEFCPRSILKRVLARAAAAGPGAENGGGGGGAEMRDGAGIYLVRRNPRKRARQGLSQPENRDAAQQSRSGAVSGAANRMV